MPQSFLGARCGEAKWQFVARPLSVQAKGLVAKLLAQLIFLGIFSLVMLVALLLLKHKMPDFDIYRVLAWLYETFPKLKK